MVVNILSALAAGDGGAAPAVMDTVVLRGDGGGDYLQALRSAANESDGCAPLHLRRGTPRVTAAGTDSCAPCS